ncbi:MAG: sulfatase [Kiritimatiellales bacterium]|nr:sulfatase [Kiritimatiellales bacterium]MCF7864292.1 sulfatase [Kiritimatiellales bacterium]
MKACKQMLVLLIAAAMFCPMAGRSAEPERPNIVFILADDLGYGDVGAYGCKDIQTPNLDQLAATGVRLTDGYASAPYCGPSRAGLMTGRYQQRHGFRHNPAIQQGGSPLGLDAGEETLGDVMTRAGYRTAAYGKWHLGASECFHPNNRGFYEFYGFLGGGHCYFPMQYADKMKAWANQPDRPVTDLYMYATPLQINGIDLPPQEGYLTDLLTTQAIAFMKGFQHRPLFLYIAYNAPHVPLEAPQEYLDKYSNIQNKDRRTYAAMVDNLDWNVGRILAALDELGKRDNTLVVFMSDNGGPEKNGADNGPLRGQKGDTTEGGVRVPFIFNWPGGLPHGREVHVPISSLDLLPTFVALGGVEPAGKPLDGVNVLPWLRGEAKGIPHEQLFWDRDGKCGMRAGDYKVFRMKEGAPWTLCNLTEDIGEQKDLSAQMPEKVEAMSAAYGAWLDPMPPARWTDPQQ